jgi:signal transduction histidine kinase
MKSDQRQNNSVAVWAPVGRDGDLIRRTLAEAGIASHPCDSVESLCKSIEDSQADAAIIAEEALRKEAIDCIVTTLHRQPRWSDFPFIILTGGGRSTAESLQRFGAIETLGYITVMERPLRRVTLITAVRAALQSRRRQHEVRDHLIEHEKAEAELVRQAEELARSNADLQQFAYATSHDLKEPLRTMVIYSQMLRSRYGDKLGAEANTFLDYIGSSAEHMQRLVDGLLAYSRLVNVETMPLAPVELQTALHWATMNLQTVIEETQTVISHDELPTVCGDHVQVVQLLQNLIHNAIKYRNHETPRIHISANRRDDGWCIGVRDNGLGIKPQYTEHIFGLFKRLHGKDIPGAGIGLALAKRIVEKHGGRIWVESAPGAGSSFYFTMPAGQ